MAQGNLSMVANSKTSPKPVKRLTDETSEASPEISEQDIKRSDALVFLTSAISICQEAGFAITYKKMPSGNLGLFIPSAKWEGTAIVLDIPEVGVALST